MKPPATLVPATSGLCDARGRVIDYIRISVTDRCNFRCLYCMPEEGVAPVGHESILSYEELLRLARLFARLGISKYKITGGEPLCRKGVVSFIHDLKRLPGVSSVTLTTNGSLLQKHLLGLLDAGIDAVNVSMDSLNEAAFRTMTRTERAPSGLADILPALDALRAAGVPLKLNMVPIKGRNEAQILPLSRYALERGMHIRFIELMPVGEAKRYERVSQADIRAVLEKEFGPLSPLERAVGNGPAQAFRVANMGATIGFISALSDKFCRTCNRVRLTAGGFFKTCLHHNKGAELLPLLRGGASDEELLAAVTSAVNAKPEEHDFSAESAAPSFFMSSVGG